MGKRTSQKVPNTDPAFFFFNSSNVEEYIKLKLFLNNLKALVIFIYFKVNLSST